MHFRVEPNALTAHAPDPPPLLLLLLSVFIREMSFKLMWFLLFMSPCRAGCFTRRMRNLKPQNCLHCKRHLGQIAVEFGQPNQQQANNETATRITYLNCVYLRHTHLHTHTHVSHLSFKLIKYAINLLACKVELKPQSVCENQSDS